MKEPNWQDEEYFLTSVRLTREDHGIIRQLAEFYDTTTRTATLRKGLRIALKDMNDRKARRERDRLPKCG